MEYLRFIFKIVYARLRNLNIDVFSAKNCSWNLVRNLDKHSMVVRSVCGSASLGHNTRIVDAYLYGKSIQIGDYVSINGPGTIFNSVGEGIVVGNYCSIGPNVSIVDFNHDIKRFTSSFFVGKESGGNTIPFVSKGPVVIEEDVWIGSNVVILGGVTIGRGSIVAAGSVVTKDVERYMVVAGSPARVVKERFSCERRKFLEESFWWNKSISELEGML